MIKRLDIMESLATSCAGYTTKSVTLLDGPTLVPPATLNDKFPYCWLEPNPGVSTEKAASSRVWASWTLRFRAISVGRAYEEAEWMADTFREVFLDEGATRPLTMPSGFAVMDREDDGGPDYPERVGSDLWSVGEDFLLRVTKA